MSEPSHPYQFPISSAMFNFNGKKVSPESESYEECIFGYSRIVYIVIYVPSLSCLAMRIHLVRDNGPTD